jgi:hypothetical protein
MAGTICIVGVLIRQPNIFENQCMHKNKSLLLLVSIEPSKSPIFLKSRVDQ